MVMNKAELIAALQNESRINVHLAGKIDRAKLDYRPTPKQRSMIELLRYLAMMGPAVVQATTSGKMVEADWNAAEKTVSGYDVDQAVKAIAAQGDTYAKLLAGVSDADLRAEIDMFGQKGTRGAFMVNLVLGSCVAYRMQLFLYLKSCGREELNTMNLWAGMDAPMPS